MPTAGEDINDQAPAQAATEQSPQGLWQPLSVAMAGVLHSAVLTGAAANAIAHLIGEAALLAGAKLKAYRQAIENQAAGDGVIIAAVSSAAAKYAAVDQELAALAANAAVERNVRGYKNKIAVAARVIEDLKNDDPASLPKDGPSDDFMNLLGDSAERASSDLMQNLFARILAGEIRRPGAFSLKTILFISTLDQVGAERTKRVKLWLTRENYIPALGSITEGQKFAELKECSYLGLLDQAQTGMHFTTAPGFAHNVLVAGCHISFTTTQTTIVIPMYWVSEVGRQIFGLLPEIVDVAVATDIGLAIRTLHGVERVNLASRLDGLPVNPDAPTIEMNMSAL